MQAISHSTATFPGFTEELNLLAILFDFFFRGFQLLKQGPNRFAGDGVAFGAAGAGDVDADHLSFEVAQRAPAIVGPQHRVVLQDHRESRCGAR